MRQVVWAGLALALCAVAAPVMAQDGGAGRAAVGPVIGAKYHTQYIRLGREGEALLYEPAEAGPKARIGLLFAHPDKDVFNEPLGREMASRGYRVLMVNYRGPLPQMEAYLPTLSLGVGYLRGIAGVQKVVVVGHSGGGHLIPLYDNIAEHGPSVCDGAEKIYPCNPKGLDALAKPDGMVLLDPTLGAFHEMSSVDPALAVDGGARNAALDMFGAANGYDPKTKRATYAPDFAKRFYAAQAARNAKVVDDAVARLHAVEQGKAPYTDDEPFVVRGMGVNAAGARLYQPDLSINAHTKAPHLLLKADGTEVQTIIHSVRPSEVGRTADDLNALGVMTLNTTVREFLSNSAIRTLPNYAFTDDDIVGVDWHSAYNSTPANAEGVTVPSLVLTMSCHYLVTPGEVIYDHLGAKDKTYASVEGAVHVFTPCGPQYGDTVKRTFDFVDRWLSKDGRF